MAAHRRFRLKVDVRYASGSGEAPDAMRYFARDRMGATIQSPGMDRMRNLLDSLATEDPEHPDVSLTHESGWCLAAFAGGLIVFENVETGDGPWHMRSVGADHILDYWRALADGHHERLLPLPWVDGYGA